MDGNLRTWRDALKYMNELFIKEYPSKTIYRYDAERDYVRNISNKFLFDWFREYEYYNMTKERVVKQLKMRKEYYQTCFSEYGSYETTIVVEIKSRKCHRGDKFARKNYIWDEWTQYGYVVWRETKSGDYVEEYRTHYEHKLMAYLLNCNLKKYADV